MKNYLPGIVLSLVLALFSNLLVNIISIDIISPSIVALFLGIIINNFLKDHSYFSPGIKFTTKKVLRLSIILLGGTLNILTVLNTGKLTYTIMIFTFIVAFGFGNILRKFLNINWKLSNLISSGILICGGSAIAAVSPVIEADEKDVSYALTLVFVFDMFMILLFPLIANILNMSDLQFGLWSGTSINDTSSVLAAAFSYGEGAGDIATMVKLTRTIIIIPLVIGFSFVNSLNNKSLENRIYKSMPFFIIGFLIMSLLSTFGIITPNLSAILKDISKFFMVVALAAVGLSTNIKDLKSTGFKPLIYTLILSISVIIVAFVVIQNIT